MFNSNQESYIAWDDHVYGLDKLVMALKDQLINTPYCHHALNEHHDLNWCCYTAVACHPKDPIALQHVNGYLINKIHPCVVPLQSQFTMQMREGLYETTISLPTSRRKQRLSMSSVLFKLYPLHVTMSICMSLIQLLQMTLYSCSKAGPRSSSASTSSSVAV
ncbi:hypothetical protein DFH05DRAFT_1493003 [Lentinula detonsa]|uniref:Uncharacterized protein n=1 Tax=Lentinula detonsa TaxID=2804962 RepID=A0A9W8TXB9_9AGAR|nr:hypothetical protein DFH05DRAFT_1493003 [Lentinula detonsa]